MSQQPELFHIEKHTVLPRDITLSRSRGNPCSVEANPTPEAKAAKREKVYKIIAGAGADCITSKEVAAKMQEPLHRISGRLSELKVLKRIEALNEKRAGAALLRVRV